MKALSVQEIHKVYQGGTHALKGISLEIESGDFFALLGANGAGKTTLIGILTGLVNKTSGSASIFDCDIDKNINGAKLATGVVPQEFNFSIFEKVIDIVTTQAGYFGVDIKTALKRSEKILKDLNLWEKKDQPSRALSGGMKRRLMIARALIHKPKFLILDEPTAGVDVELRHSMWKYLKELNKNGTTILLTTHYLEEVEELCKNVAIIKDGTIVKQGSVKSLTSSLDSQSYIFTLDKTNNLGELKNFEYEKIDANSVEVKISGKQEIGDLINEISKKEVRILDIKPKANRIEQLYLDILKN